MAAEITSHLTALSVLAVDDEKDILDTIEDVLDKAKVDRAEDYDSASQKLKDRKYDLAILDIMGVNGLDLLVEAVNKGIPTVMLTAHAMNPETLKASINKGALSYLPKEELTRLDDLEGIEEVGVWGFSMGGAVALMSIKKAPKIKAVVSEASYASLTHMASELFRIPVVRYPLGYLIGLWAKIFLGIDLRNISPVEAVQNTTIPVLLIHSLTDEVIPFSHARLLEKALGDNPRAEFWFHAGAAHGELAKEYQRRVADFFQRHL